MKSRAEALDSSLDSLKTSFERISQLTTSLAPPSSSSSLQRQSHTPTNSESHSNPTSTKTTPSLPPRFSPLVHLPPLLSLPILLRVMDRKQSDLLWGTYEPALRSWEDENVEGVEEIGRECRDVLRNARRGSVSSNTRVIGGGGLTEISAN